MNWRDDRTMQRFLRLSESHLGLMWNLFVPPAAFFRNDLFFVCLKTKMEELFTERKCNALGLVPSCSFPNKHFLSFALLKVFRRACGFFWIRNRVERRKLETISHEFVIKREIEFSLFVRSWEIHLFVQTRYINIFLFGSYGFNLKDS